MGTEIVYQGVLASNGWRGVADFLVRVDEPSELGLISYEAWDTKLARSRAKPAHVSPTHVLLARARADPGAAARADARRPRHGRVGDLPTRGFLRFRDGSGSRRASMSLPP